MYYGVFEAIGDENGRWQMARHTVDFVFFQARYGCFNGKKTSGIY